MNKLGRVEFRHTMKQKQRVALLKPFPFYAGRSSWQGFCLCWNCLLKYLSNQSGESVVSFVVPHLVKKFKTAISVVLKSSFAALDSFFFFLLTRWNAAFTPKLLIMWK